MNYILRKGHYDVETDSAKVARKYLKRGFNLIEGHWPSETACASEDKELFAMDLDRRDMLPDTSHKPRRVSRKL
jgi:hypothetical protein